MPIPIVHGKCLAARVGQWPTNHVRTAYNYVQQDVHNTLQTTQTESMNGIGSRDHEPTFAAFFFVLLAGIFTILILKTRLTQLLQTNTNHKRKRRKYRTCNCIYQRVFNTYPLPSVSNANNFLGLIMEFKISKFINLIMNYF